VRCLQLVHEAEFVLFPVLSSDFFDDPSQFIHISGKNGGVTTLYRFALLLLLLGPSLCLAQTTSRQTLAQALTVQPPFDFHTYQPLTGHERWERWVNEDGRSASIHVESIGTALYNQTFDVPEAWSRTGGGLARRLGSAYGSNLIQNTMHESMASLAGTDPRYFPCACTGLFRRGGHVIKMSFLTYTHSGRLTLDMPQIGSIYGSSMIQAMWYPSHYTALVQGVQSGHIEAGFIGTEHLVQEFAPELKRFFHLHW
jgi:hypothetical protein